MAGDHPTREELEKFMRADLTPMEMAIILRHLMTGCRACREITGPLWSLGEGEDGELPPADESACAAYDAVIDRVLRRVQEEQGQLLEAHHQAAEAYEELLRHPPARQSLLVVNSSRYRSRALCGHLLEKSHEAGFQDPARAIDLSRLALAMAQILDREDPRGCRGTHLNLQARAWAQLGNALRISSDHQEAEAAFERAESLLHDQGRNGLLDRARLLDFLASLRRDQRQYVEAFRLHDRVSAIYQRLGQWHLLGRTLAQKSTVCGEMGDNEAEMALLRRALDLLDPQAEPRMFLAARHNLILALNQSGRHREAFALLFHTRPLYLQTGERMNLLRLRWLEGQVAVGLGRTEQAEVAFREVREAFVELGLAYDAALASLDLAGVYAVQGRPTDMRRLAQEMLAIFQSRSIHREAVAALLVFRQAAEIEQAGLSLVREVSAFLKRARHDPDLRFQPTS
jgi:tetratricopeptide (TPR) repeat protein